MKRIETLLQIIEKNQKETFKAWKDANDKYDDETYSEEYEDTLQRKYDEGYADALESVLQLFAEVNLEEIQKDIATNGAQDVLSWLEEVYGEGLHETGAWQTYMEDETEEGDN